MHSVCFSFIMRYHARVLTAWSQWNYCTLNILIHCKPEESGEVKEMGDLSGTGHLTCLKVIQHLISKYYSLTSATLSIPTLSIPTLERGANVQFLSFYDNLYSLIYYVI